jgi:5-methylthioribose kinase
MATTGAAATPSLTDNEAGALTASLRRMGLLGAEERPFLRMLTGGVSSLIVLVETARGPLCVKQALPKLKVAQDWFAPVERNRAEVAWMREAALLSPGAVPAILGEDPEAHAFAMEFLDPGAFPVWKAMLLAGAVAPTTAQEVGRVLASIHAGTAGRADVAERFANEAQFDALRLDPYLTATAAVHADLATALHRLRERTASTKLALVHGDVSPKNVLVGQRRVVLLDAECAWYGDPAFDLAFCLNHLVLKSAVRRDRMAALAASYAALRDAYLAGVAWEPPDGLDRRTAALLPGLLLARIDGKSPVEYLVDEADRELVRHFARAKLRAPPVDLADLWRQWSGESAT